jgi:YbbR domain-containing protein
MRGRLSYLAVSMALAFCLWLSLSGLDTNLVDFTVGLRLHSLPDDLIITGETPKEVNVRILANAAQVRFLADRKLSLPVDLSLAREGHNVFPVLPETLQLPRGVEVSAVDPDVIEFETLRPSQKNVPVKPHVVGRPAPDFHLEDLVLEPESVTIKGPPEILDQVNHLETTPLVVDGLTQSAIFVVNMVLPEGIVTTAGSKEVRAVVTISELRLHPAFPDLPEVSP